MSQERYYIGPGLKDKLRDVIFRVDGMPNATSGPRVPNVYSGIDQPIIKANPIRLAAYPKTVTWGVGQTQAVMIYDSGTLRPSGDGTVAARNVCTTFEEGADGGPNSTMSWCIVSKAVGGATLAVEGPQRPFRICTFTGSWSIGTVKAVAFKSDTNRTTEAINIFWPVPAGPRRDCAVAKEGTAWYLVVPQLYAANAATAAELTTAALEFKTLPVVSFATSSTATFRVDIAACESTAQANP